MGKLSPSILSADFSRLGEQSLLVSEAGADYLHVDVMDGHFVPNISYGAVVMKSLDKLDVAPYDVHLMIEHPDDYLGDFVTERTEFITVHQEACTHLDRTIDHIHSYGVGAGVSLNPATPLVTLEHVLNQVDLVLIMSVNPGFGGQSLIPYTLDKVRKLKEIRDAKGYEFSVVESGVDIVVAGSGVFGAPDIAERTREMKGMIG